MDPNDARTIRELADKYGPAKVLEQLSWASVLAAQGPIQKAAEEVRRALH